MVGWDGMGCSMLGRWAELLSLLRERMWILLRANELNPQRGQSVPGNSTCRVSLKLLNIGQRGSYLLQEGCIQAFPGSQRCSGWTTREVAYAHYFGVGFILDFLSEEF